MASYFPPTEILPIYNPNNFVSTTSGLTISDADSRYLRLTGGTLSGSTLFNAGLISASTASFSTGLATSPSIAFSANSDNGFFLDNATNGGIGVTCEGARVFTFLPSATGFNSTVLPMRFQAGRTASDCALFGSTANRGTGIYWSGTNDSILNLASNSVARLTFDTVATISVPMRSSVTSIATPAYSFTTSTGSGFHCNAANDISLVTNGTSRLNVTNSAITSTLAVTVPAGSVSAPTLNFAGATTTGLWLNNAGNGTIGFATLGTSRFLISNGTVTNTVPLLSADGTVSAPSYSFTNNTNLGIYREAANTMSFTAGGVKQMSISTTGVTFTSPPSITTSYRILAKDSTPQDLSSKTLLTWTSSATSGSDISFASNVVTINTTGIYLIVYSVGGGADSGSTRRTFLDINNSGLVNAANTTAYSDGTSLFSASSCSVILSLTATNTLRLYGSPVGGNTAYNNSTGSQWAIYKLF